MTDTERLRNERAITEAMSLSEQVGYDRAIAECMSSEEAGALVGISASRVRFLCARHSLGRKLGRDWVLWPSDVEWLREERLARSR